MLDGRCDSSIHLTFTEPMRKYSISVTVYGCIEREATRIYTMAELINRLFNNALTQRFRVLHFRSTSIHCNSSENFTKFRHSQ